MLSVQRRLATAGVMNSVLWVRQDGGTNGFLNVKGHQELTFISPKLANSTLGELRLLEQRGALPTGILAERGSSSLNTNYRKECYFELL